jgi:hypothetical protein
MADKGNAKAERRREDAGGIKDKAYAKAKEIQPDGGGPGQYKKGGKPLPMMKGRKAK